MEEVFKKADSSEGIIVDREKHANLRFADDVTLLNEKTKQMKKKTPHLNSLNSESLKAVLPPHTHIIEPLRETVYNMSTGRQKDLSVFLQVQFERLHIVVEAKRGHGK